MKVILALFNAILKVVLKVITHSVRISLKTLKLKLSRKRKLTLLSLKRLSLKRLRKNRKAAKFMVR